MIRLETQNSVAIWTIHRPERRNALSRDMFVELGRLAARAASDTELRAVVITAEGEEAFCSGADLKERILLNAEQAREVLDRCRDAFDAIDSLPVPVVAALNGVALGGGLELALTADFRVAVESVVLGLPETGLGIIPGAGGTQRLPRLIGPARAKEMIVLGKRLSAHEALAMGLINRIAEPGQSARACALTFLEPLNRMAPLAVRSALVAVDQGLDCGLAEGLDAERRAYEQTLLSHDREEALAAFRDKRPPHFKGH